MSLTYAVPNNSLDMWFKITLHTPGTSHQDRRWALYHWDDLFLQGLKWPLNLCCSLNMGKIVKTTTETLCALSRDLENVSLKWARHHIWHLFLQVTTHAVWIMGAAVPSASPSQEAECVPALTTRFWRGTMSPVQVGGHNEADRARGLRSSCPSILPSWSLPVGQRSNENLIYSNANLLINK